MLGIQEDTKALYRISEGISGTWFYHLEPKTSAGIPTALCGARVMRTSVPVSAWGTRTHLKERWCQECADHARQAEIEHAPIARTQLPSEDR
jgi:hypothetical protein